MSIKEPDTVYVTVGRRSGKTMIQARQIKELMKSGKKVVLIEPKCTSRHIKGRPAIDLHVDPGILTPERMERANQILDMILKGEQHG